MGDDIAVTVTTTGDVAVTGKPYRWVRQINGNEWRSSGPSHTFQGGEWPTTPGTRSWEVFVTGSDGVEYASGPFSITWEVPADDPPADVDDPGPLAGFTLVDAADQSVLASLTDGASVELTDPDGGSYGPGRPGIGRDGRQRELGADGGQDGCARDGEPGSLLPLRGLCVRSGQEPERGSPAGWEPHPDGSGLR